MSDKDHKSVLREILPFSENIILTKPDYERAQEPGILYSDSLKIKSTNNLMMDNSVKGALEIADKMNYKRIMIIGSFFMVSDALKALGIHGIPIE